MMAHPKMKRVSNIVDRHSYYFAELTESEKNYIKTHLDLEDKTELSMMRSKSWEQELEFCFTRRESDTVLLIKSKNFSGSCIFGIRQLSSSSAIVWLLQTVDFKTNSSEFFKNSWPVIAFRFAKAFVLDAQEIYPSLCNFIPPTRIDMLRILSKLDFSFFEHETRPCGFIFFGIGPETEMLARSSAWEYYLDYEIIKN